MEKDQFEKQLEWLENSRREDKQTIAALQKRMTGLEELLEKVTDQLKAQDAELTKTGVRVTRMDSFDAALSTHRAEVKKELDAHEKRAKKRENYAREKFDEKVTDLTKEIAGVDKQASQVTKLKESIESLKREGLDHNRRVNEVEGKIKETTDHLPDIRHAIKLLNDDRTGDLKRVTDVQGEVTTLRKRLDEQRAQIDLATEDRKKAETRLNELSDSEESRRKGQREFIEEISRSKLDVEKSFTEWTKRFSAIEEKAETLTTALQTYSEIELSLRKAQKGYEDIIEQITRRIHEITEMQRLGEERFRQEWTTFKSDDQKRWVNYTLTQEEQSKESTRRNDRLNDRLTTIEELFQDMQDAVEHSSEQMETMMQGLTGVLREWLADNERYSDTK